MKIEAYIASISTINIFIRLNAYIFLSQFLHLFYFTIGLVVDIQLIDGDFCHQIFIYFIYKKNFLRRVGQSKEPLLPGVQHIYISIFDI